MFHWFKSRRKYNTATGIWCSIFSHWAQKDLVLGEFTIFIGLVKLNCIFSRSARFVITLLSLINYPAGNLSCYIGYVSMFNVFSSVFSIEVSLERHYNCRFDLISLILNHSELMFNLFISLRDVRDEAKFCLNVQRITTT